MTVAELEQERLAELSSQIETWQEGVLDAAADPKIDRAANELLAELEPRLVPLNEQVDEADLGPRELAEFRGLIIRLIGIAQSSDGRRAEERLDDALTTLEAMRHIVRDANDLHVHLGASDSAALVAVIDRSLPHARRTDFARLIDISPRHFQRLAKGEGSPPRRLILVAQLLTLLSRAWTETGALAWFDRPHRELDGRTPAEVLGDPAFESTLLTMAKQGLAQHGG